MVEPAIAVFIGRQEESVLVAGSRPAVLVLAPEGGREPPDVGVGQAGIAASGELLAAGQQRLADLLGQGESLGDRRKRRSVLGSIEGKACNGVEARLLRGANPVAGQGFPGHGEPLKDRLFTFSALVM